MRWNAAQDTDGNGLISKDEWISQAPEILKTAFEVAVQTILAREQQ